MKRLFFTFIVLIIFLGFSAIAKATIIYDNTTTPQISPTTGNIVSVYVGLGVELGDQITLASTERTVTEFLFGYRIKKADGDETGRVRFYANDGLSGEPGSLLFDSGAFQVFEGFQDKILTGLSVNVPDTFTWTVRFEGVGANPEDYGARQLFDPPTIGSSGDFFWSFNDVDGWIAYDNALPGYIENLKARVTAVPEPATLFLLGSGLAGFGLWRKRRFLTRN